MTIRAALLDERGIFLRIDELDDESKLTDRHLKQITECDLPPGEYEWVENAANMEYGGAFWKSSWVKSVRDTLEKAEKEKAMIRRARARGRGALPGNN